MTFARALITVAETCARALHLRALAVQPRIELAEDHATFPVPGLIEVARTAHPGHARPTSLTFHRLVG